MLTQKKTLHVFVCETNDKVTAYSMGLILKRHVVLDSLCLAE